MQSPKRLVRAVVFDWGGTVLDYGNALSTQSLAAAFRARDLLVSPEEIRRFVGQDKKDHIRELLRIDRVHQQFVRAHGENPSEKDVSELYRLFEPALIELLSRHCELIPGVLETVERLRIMGVKIGSCTGYSKAVMAALQPLAERQGFLPDSLVSAVEVSRGRPFPWMIFRNAENLGVYPLSAVVKVGDTLQDVAEARNAGCWAVGVLRGGSLVGRAREEFDALAEAEQVRELRAARRLLLGAGADFVLDSVAELPRLLKRIHLLLEKGEGPDHCFRLEPQPYRLCTAGPVSTPQSVKLAMMADDSPDDPAFVELFRRLRHDLLRLATAAITEYTAVVVPGGAELALEVVLRSALPGALLVVGDARAAGAARALGLRVVELAAACGADAGAVEQALQQHPELTHALLPHVERSSGALNALEPLLALLKRRGLEAIVDATLTLGALPLDAQTLQIDFLLGSACHSLEAMPGVSFVVARKSALKPRREAGALDLSALAEAQERTRQCVARDAPVQQLRALAAALRELEEEGGPAGRLARYAENQRLLGRGLAELGFAVKDLKEHQNSFFLAVEKPRSPQFNWGYFRDNLRSQGFLLDSADDAPESPFALATCGRLLPEDVGELLQAIKQIKNW